MIYQEALLDTFTIVGISVRTSNANGKSAEDIGQLFNRFFTQQVGLTISNKLSDDLYCIYTDYESDFNGQYTVILGYMVSSIENLSDVLVFKTIPKLNYRKYSAEGKIYEAIGKIWNHIWSEGNKIDRAYIADFDIYGAEAQNPENAKVYTFLSVK